MKNKKRQKYANGTSIKNYIDSPQKELKDNELAIAKAIYEGNTNPLYLATKTASNVGMQVGSAMGGMGSIKGINPELAKGLDSALIGTSNMFELGGNTGNVPVEVENKEVGELPNGKLLEFLGKSHKQGGIDVDLPEGTEIYSDKIKVNGKTMAKRKKTREKKEKTLVDYLSKDASDIINKNTLERVKSINIKEDEKDKFIQQAIKALSEVSKVQNEVIQNNTFAMGGKVSRKGDRLSNKYSRKVNKSRDGAMKNGDSESTHLMRTEQLDNGSWVSFPTLFQDKQKGWINMSEDAEKDWKSVYKEALKRKEVYNFGDEKDAALNFGKGSWKKKMVAGGKVEELELDDAILDMEESFLGSELDDALADLGGLDDVPNKTNTLGTKAGNVTAIGGDIFSSVAPLLNTLKARSEDTPNINAYEDYGKNALNTIDSSLDYVEQVRDETIADTNKISNNQRASNRNNARSVNTKRALDTFTTENERKSINKIYSDYSSKMIELLKNKATFENIQDSQVMKGEESRDLADREDKDNFYTQRGQDLSTMGQGIQQTGKDINSMDQQEMIFNLSKQISKYGLSIDKKGNIVKI